MLRLENSGATMRTSGQNFDFADLEAFTVADALDRFGVAHSRSRAACPLCRGGNSQAFAFGGPNGHRLWQCFSCGAKGNVAQLYAALAGVPVGRAVAEIASILGLIPSTPGEWDSRRAERLAGEALDRAYAGRERRRMNELAEAARIAEGQAATMRRVAWLWGRTAVALGAIFDALAAQEIVDAWDRHEARP